MEKEKKREEIGGNSRLREVVVVIEDGKKVNIK